MVVWRAGERQTVSVSLGELPEDDELAALTQSDADTPSSSSVESLGMTVASLTDELRQRFELGEDARGVVVVEVDEGGPAGDESLRPGDVIVEVSQEEVTTPAEVEAKVEQARQEDKRSVLLLIDRQSDLRFVALRFREE